jgi:hypothetical protein
MGSGTPGKQSTTEYYKSNAFLASSSALAASNVNCPGKGLVDVNPTFLGQLG